MLLKSRCIAAIALLLAAASAIADEYPAKMVTLVVPAAAGGAVDANARVVGEALQRLWGRPVIVPHDTAGGCPLMLAMRTRHEGVKKGGKRMSPTVHQPAVLDHRAAASAGAAAAGVLGLLSGVLLIETYLGRLVLLDPNNPLVLGPAALEGFLVNPAWYVWLALVLRREA